MKGARKMKYTTPEMECRLLAAADVITASSGVEEGEGGQIVLPDGDDFE